jgi:hypothetical protein
MSQQDEVRIVDPEDEDYNWSSCPTCNMRIGSHTIIESVRCGLLSREMAREILRGKKEEEPAVEPAVDPVVEPAVEPAVDPVVEPTVEPVATSSSWQSKKRSLPRRPITLPKEPRRAGYRGKYLAIIYLDDLIAGREGGTSHPPPGTSLQELKRISQLKPYNKL